ncbi:hypothetical protein BD779DRAFT_1679783 [Infundibulicybe gibba]|nr:hypothetical protein BD779DRAFT_1679783 [Infundibulicybe gibba]
MNDLAEQMEDMLRFVKTHRASTSLLRTFPPEILVAIFTEYIHIVTNSQITPASEPPLNLMWICSRWRRIVLDTPQLWTMISSSTPMVDLWVNRSGKLPLDLKLDSSSRGVSVLNALIPQAHCWERADLVLQSDSNLTLSPMKGRLQSLKTLKVSFDDITGFLDFCDISKVTNILFGLIQDIRPNKTQDFSSYIRHVTFLI